MKTILKLIRRFIAIMLLSSVLILILNFTLLAVYISSRIPNAHPWQTADEVAGQAPSG